MADIQNVESDRNYQYSDESNLYFEPHYCLDTISDDEKIDTFLSALYDEMMSLTTIFEKIGLTKKESDTYLATLEYGPATITEIARLTGHKRSTLYNVTHDLLQKGIIVLTRRNSRTLYDAEKPKKLLTMLQTRQREFEGLLPKLDAIRNTKQLVPGVGVYEGEEALKSVYGEIYTSLSVKNETCFLTSIKDLQMHAPFALDEYIRTAQGKNFKVRELILNDDQGRRYVKNLRSRNMKHPVRLLPTDFPVHNDIIVHGNRVAIFSLKNRGNVTIIDNAEVSITIRSLYEWAWGNGKGV